MSQPAMENSANFINSSPMTTELVSALIEELEHIRGHVPRSLRTRLATLGIHLSSAFYERREVRAQCTAILRTGAQCKRKCAADHDVCEVHMRPAVEKCSEMTSKNERCKCSVFRGFDMCWRHARKAGVLPEVPTECAICYEEMTDETRFKTTCGHHFHTECFDKWAFSKGTMRRTRTGVNMMTNCPMCRKVVSAKTKVPSWYFGDGIIATHFTTGREWAWRLQAMPMTPFMSPDEINNAAWRVGHILLDYISRQKQFMSSEMINMIMNTHGITPYQVT